jgi:hypothetical protein
LRGASPAARLRPVTAPAYTVKALDETTWQAFAALVERNHGIFGGCWCVGFHPKEAGQGPVTAALNRERKLNRVRAGTCPARKWDWVGDLQVSGRQAACVYSLIRPPRTGFRRICCLSMSVRVARATSGSSSGTRWAMPWCGRAVL